MSYRQEKSKLVEDLVQQNQRLTNELAEATKSEELLSSQLEQVNERLSARLSNRSGHAAQVDALQEELHILSQRKQDLERRLKLAQSEKSHLSGELDELGDKVLLFESLLSERDLRIGELALEIGELRDSGGWLSSKLESMISLNERLVECVRPSGEGAQDGPAATSSDDLKTISERDRSQLVDQLKELRLRRNSRMKANEMILLEAGERRRKSLAAGLGSKRQHTRSHHARRRRAATNGLDSESDHHSLSSNCGGDDKDEATLERVANPQRADKLSDLIGEIYLILNDFLLALQQRKEALAAAATTTGNSAAHQQVLQHLAASSIGAAEDSGVGSADEITGQQSVGQSITAGARVDEEELADLALWRRLASQLKTLVEEMPCSSCQLMIGERGELERLQRVHTKLTEELRVKSDEHLRDAGENIELTAQLGVLADKCKLLEGDLENCDKPKEEIVALAWKTRDEAVARKNTAEIQLARTRIENMQISSQLMEVVQQKGALSQKLAQFEDDIHYMMQRSVRARFTWEEYAEQTRRLGRAGKFQQQEQQSAASLGQQLLSLTGVNLLSPTRRRQQQAQLDAESSANKSRLADGGNSISSDTTDVSPQRQPTTTTSNILASLKTSGTKLNLRFWQRNLQHQQQRQSDQQVHKPAESAAS